MATARIVRAALFRDTMAQKPTIKDDSSVKMTPNRKPKPVEPSFPSARVRSRYATAG